MAWSVPWAGQGVRRQDSLGAGEQGGLLCPQSCFVQLEPAWALGQPTRTPHPSYSSPYIVTTQALPSLTWSQLLPLQLLSPSCVCFRGQRRESTQPAVCSQLHLLLSSDPSQPCPVLPMECLPLLPPKCSLAMATQTYQPGGPRGWHWQQFSRSLFPEQIVWERCQLCRKPASILCPLCESSYSHRGALGFPSFPARPHPQAPACLGARRRQEQRSEQVFGLS